jgi:hypothetical protein
MSEPSLDAALQARLDEEAEGWRLAHYVAVVGIERMSSDGSVETDVARYTADGQAEYVTEGLLLNADRDTSREDCD